MFNVTAFERLRRWLVVNDQFDPRLLIIQAVNEAGVEAVVQLIADISSARRAPSNNTCVVGTASLFCLGPEIAQKSVMLPSTVCRTAVDLFKFIRLVRANRGWGNTLRRAVALWYDKEPERLVWNVLKYNRRESYRHRDVLRLAHPIPKSDAQNKVFQWILTGKYTQDDRIAGLIQAVATARRTEPSLAGIVTLNGIIHEIGLPITMLPTWWRQLPNAGIIWNKLLETGMGGMAIMREIKNMLNPAHAQLLEPTLIQRMSEPDFGKQVHPALLLLRWNDLANNGHVFHFTRPIQQAFDIAFSNAVASQQPTAKRIVLGLDASGSMRRNMTKEGELSALTAQCAVAIALVRVEPRLDLIAFNSNPHYIQTTPDMALSQLINRVTAISGKTNCAAPIEWAMENHVDADAFVVFTDEEHLTGRTPAQALQHYYALNNKMPWHITCAMTSSALTTADPGNPYMVDLPAFDLNTPTTVSTILRDF